MATKKETVNKGLEFRTLTADEVECRIGTYKAGSGMSLLLYKDARVDQRLLDEVVGPYNWKNHYEVIKNVLHCTVEIWDEDKKEWVGKQNCGTESNTEAQKGEASDAFKRACFSLGIGRELYDTPFIWIKEVADKNTKLSKYKVVELEYDDNRKPCLINIINSNTKEQVYFYVVEAAILKSFDKVSDRETFEVEMKRWRSVLNRTSIISKCKELAIKYPKEK